MPSSTVDAREESSPSMDARSLLQHPRADHDVRAAAAETVERRARRAGCGAGVLTMPRLDGEAPHPCAEAPASTAASLAFIAI